MKITRDTPEQLIIENNPIWLAVFLTLFSLIFIGIGLFMMREEFWFGLLFVGSGLIVGTLFSVIFIRRTQFIFDRPGNLVEMRRKSLLGFTNRTWELQYLDRAIVQSSRSSEGTTTYRAALVFDGGMDAGTHPITIVYSSGSGADRAANAVNHWLAADG